jgi:uncharacterized integral membrane protein
MNKIIALLLFVVMGSLASNAQIHCPYGGKVDCSGECGLFTDNNGDGFCDYGKLSKESNPVVDTTTEPAAATPTDRQACCKLYKSTSATASPRSETEKQSNSSTNKLQQSDNKEVKSQKAEQIARIAPAQTQQVTPIKAPYHLFELSIALLLLYLVSVLLAKYRVYTLATHRKIWNIGLTVSFLVSCIIGLLMAYFVNVRSFPACYRSLVLYHVEFGIAMTVIAIFHLIWHWRYFLNIFKSKKQKSGKPANK